MTTLLRLKLGSIALALALATLLVIGASPLHAISAPDGNSVLILDSSVVGGSSSLEAVEAMNLGFTVVIANDTDWGNTTAEEFATFRALILGDPECPDDEGPLAIAAAEDNRGTWSPVVTGNIILAGTDPSFHFNDDGIEGARVFTSAAIGYAAGCPGKTGLYVSLSCYYGNADDFTPVDVLDQFGSFTANGADGGGDDVHVVVSDPALPGVNDSSLSNWGSSVHEVFDGFPSSFLPFAILRDSEGAETGSLQFRDGSSGVPVILTRPGCDLPPALVYDCTLTGKFKYSWIDGEADGDELCLFGQGLSTKVNLKAFYVQGVLQPDHECEVSGAESSSEICDSCDSCDGDSEHRDPEEACAVKIIYGECQTSEGIQKFFWFPSGYDYGDPNSYTPDFCNLHVEDCLNQIDSVCNGLTLKNDEMLMKFTKGSKSPVYGTTFYRNLFKYTDNFDECDECPPWQPCDSVSETSQDDCVYECEQDSLEVTALDIAGALSQCTISTTRVPTTMPFNYLNFCDYQEDGKTKVSKSICAPKTLCGPFYSYWASLDGRSYYPSPEDICINNDLTIEGNSERGNPGYLFASIEACASYRLNTSMTACANLLADACKGEFEDGYGYLDHSSQESPSNGDCGCTVRQGSLNYGVLCVALYLESKGYQFNKYGTENVIRKGVGLPPKDN